MSRELNILKNYILYFVLFLIICLVGVSDVFAIEYTGIGDIGNNTDVTVEVSYEIESQAPLVIERGQTYYTQIKVLNIFVNNYQFSSNTHYQLEFYLPGLELNSNANFYEVYDQNNNRCNISYTYSVFNTDYPRWDFECSSNTNSIYIRVSNAQNQNISSTGYFSWTYAYLRYSDTRIGDNSSQNTQDIIDNQTQNTQDIINNQNQNKQDMIDSQQACSFITITSSYAQNKNSTSENGDLSYNKYFNTTDMLSITSNSIIKITKVSNDYGKVCYYDDNRTFINCISSVGLALNSTIDIPSNASYVRFVIYNAYDRPNFLLKTCKNGNQAISDDINNLNDSLNDDDSSGATSNASGFFSNFNTDTFGLTSIITAPLNLINSITNSTCSNLVLPLPYVNENLTLPCMSSIYSSYFGSFYTLYQTITFGIISYWVCVRIFNLVKDFKNPDHDEIEVLDL